MRSLISLKIEVNLKSFTFKVVHIFFSYKIIIVFEFTSKFYSLFDRKLIEKRLLEEIKEFTDSNLML